MNSSRTRNSLFNVIANTTALMIQTVLMFAVRIVFINMLNEEYLGIQGLFTNIIAMLSLTELGFSTAISFSLYKPLADNDVDKINKIITFLKRIYYIIGIIVFIFGLVLLPFIRYSITGYSMGNFNIIYILYLCTLSFSYFFAYPEVLVSADQKYYIAAYFHLFSNILIGIFQIVFLLLTKSFINYLIINMVITILHYIALCSYVKRRYKEYDFSYKGKLGKEDKKQIGTNVKSLFIYKIGDYLINSTDNILISNIVNISVVGLYSNYLSIIQILKNLFNSIISSITSSFGNLIVKEEKEIQENVFNVMEFFTFYLSGLAVISLYFLFNTIIQICFGSSYLLNNEIVVIICLNFYLMVTLLPIDVVKSAAGKYYVDRYANLIQAIINLVASIVLGKIFGLIGILCATAISYILVATWERPFIIYKYVFDKSAVCYIKKIILEIIFIVLNLLALQFILRIILISSLILSLIVYFIIIFSFYSFMFVLFNYKRREFKYFYNIILKK